MVIAVLNRKGGVGKTSLTKDLGHALVAGGRRVLQVGLDPQSSLEVLAGLGFDTPPERTVSRLLLPEEFPDAASRWRRWCTRRRGRARWCRRARRWRRAERALGEPGRGGANQRLRRGLERLGVEERCDVVLIDCPPGMTPLTMNALVAASHVLVPTPLDFLSVAGLAVLLETVEEVREYDNPGAALPRDRRHPGRRAHPPRARGPRAARAAVRRGRRRRAVPHADPADDAGA